MRPLRAIIIDDEQNGIDALRILIEKYVANITVVAESRDPFQGVNLIESYLPEIVFLDINMPGMDGFELLNKLSWRSFNLVFTTAHQQYGLKALKQNAVDYLLKPIGHTDLQTTVERIVKRQLPATPEEQRFNFDNLIQSLNGVTRNKILVNSKSGVESLSIAEIAYFESRSKYTCIHMMGGSQIITPKTLREFDEQLCSTTGNFMRVHHSFIINLHKVLRYVRPEECIVLSEGQRIPLSKSKRDLFYSWMQP